MLFRGAVESSEMKLPITCEPLLACATRNRNILHLCCEVESSTVTVQRNDADSLKDGRGTHVLKLDNPCVTRLNMIRDWEPH